MKYLIIMIFSSIFLFSSSTTLGKLTIDRLGLQNDKIYIFDFFASWCVSCDKEAPLLNSLVSKLNPNKVEIIGIDVDENLNDGLAFQQKHNIRFRVINDFRNIIVSKFKPAGMPALYYIKNNEIIYSHIGAIPNIDKKILKDLEKLEKDIYK